MSTAAAAATATPGVASSGGQSTGAGFSQGGGGFSPGGGGPPGGHQLSDLLTFVHVIGVLGLFIAIGIEILAVLRLRRARRMGQVREWGLAARAMFWVHVVSTPLIWASGLYLLFSQWNFTTAWLDVSMITMLGLSICGMWISGWRLRAIDMSARQILGEAIPLSLRRQLLDPVMNTFVQVIAGLALGITYLMLIKPDLVQSLLVLVICGAAGGVVAQVTGRFDRAARVEEAV